MPDGNPDRIPVLKIEQELKLLPELYPDADETTRRLYAEVQPSIVQVRTDKGAGSGFFVDGEGRVVTDAHVVQDASEIIGITREGKRYKASLEKLDDINDLAVLKLENLPASQSKPLALGRSDTLAADARVWALGHPQGVRPVYISPGYFRLGMTPLEFKLMEGPEAQLPLVKEMMRMSPKELADVEAYLARSVLHTKVHIEPGNSGGPLVDDKGQVVGVADWVEGNHSNSYFTPAEKVKELVQDKNHKFEFTHAFAGADWANTYKWQWKNMTPVAITETGLAGLSAYGLSRWLPRATAVGVGIIGINKLGDDASSYFNSTDSRDSLKYGVASGSDIVMTAGAVARFIPATRAYSLALMGAGVIGRLSADFIPNRLIVTDIKRKDGDPRAPLDGALILEGEDAKNSLRLKN